jgi:hypothetical protein
MAKRIVTDKQRKNSEAKDRKLANLKPFKPGQSGNPEGRPKSITLSEAYRKQLAQPVPGDKEGRTFAEVIASRVVVAAAMGDVGAAREIADRTEGKPRQALDVDMQVHDWRQMARDYGVSEEDVISEARRLIESVDDGGDPSSD